MPCLVSIYGKNGVLSSFPKTKIFSFFNCQKVSNFEDFFSPIAIKANFVSIFTMLKWTRPLKHALCPSCHLPVKCPSKISKEISRGIYFII